MLYESGMAKFLKKAMLYAGRDYQSPDGKVSVTAERLKHWRDGFQKLSENNYAVPADWDHVADLSKAAPIKSKARSAKNTVGKLHSFDVAADGSHAELTVEITDPTAQGRAERNEVYISPVIFDKWKDGAGNEYSDLITHVDIVNHPVDNSQGPFVPVEPGTLALGIRMGLSPVYRMAADDDEARKPFGDPDEGDGDELPDGNNDPTDVEDENPDMPESESNDKIAEAIRAHLDQLGAALPADWTFKSDAAAEILLTALKTLVKANQKAEAENKPDEEEDDSPGGDDMGKLADPGFAAMSLASRNALAYAEREHRKGIQSRLDSLRDSGRCTVDEHSKRRDGVAAVRLSLSEAGEPELSDLEKWIESREAVPQGTFYTPEQRTAATKRMALAEPGEHQQLEADEAAAEKLIDAAFGKRTKAAT